ncbi:ead/Ea22-like family protein [Cronobacter malonaticus]
MSTAKLKAAAEKARWGDWSAYKPHSGARGYEVRVGIEVVAQHCLKDDAAFIAEASPKAVLELIAALEAAERQKGYLREQCNEWERKAISNFENCSEMAARIEELESQRQMAFIASNRWADKFREAEKRIAELEARTVKLPPCVDDLHGVGMVMSADAVTKALSAAGINLETGGEA